MQVGPEDMLLKSGTRVVLAKILNWNPGPAVAGRSHNCTDGLIAGLITGLTNAAPMNPIRISSNEIRNLLDNNKLSLLDSPPRQTSDE
jgi:hypothetical protein